MAEQLLLLGWGTSSQELKKYVRDHIRRAGNGGGTENNADGTDSERQRPVGPCAQIRALGFRRRTPRRDAVQVKFYERGGKDYSIATYTNVKLQSISESQVKLAAPKNAQGRSRSISSFGQGMKKTRASTYRLEYLDWVRGIGALIMLQGHVFDSFTRQDLRTGGAFVLAVRGWNAAGDLSVSSPALRWRS